MTRRILTFAAVLALGLGAAACAGKPATTESAAPAADKAAAAPEANAPAPAEAAAPAAPDANAPAPAEAAAPAAPDANAPAPDANAPAAETAAAAPAPPVQTEPQMLRDVRNGAHVSLICAKVDNMTVTGFKQCVADALSQAEAKGSGTDAFHLGADYRAWAFLGEHAAEMREKGQEWSKQYRQAYAERENFRKSASDLLDRTGLKESKVCNAIAESDCPK